MSAVLERPAVGESTRTSETTEPAAINRVAAKNLHTAVSNALNFAGSPADRIPAIATVRIEATDTELVAVATDRFVLGATRVDYSGEAFAFTMGSEDAKTLARMAKTLKRDEGFRTVDIDLSERRLMFRFSSGEAMTVRAADSEFPKWRQLLPADDQRMGATIGVGYNAGRLAKFAKVHNEDGARMVVFPTGGERGPGAAVVQIGADFIGLVMPLRAPGDAERYQRPLWAAATGADQ